MADPITISTILVGAGSGILVPLANKIFGPAADEAGLILGDWVRTFRLQRQIELLASTQKMLRDAGVDAKQVSLKTLLPLMENASLEENPLLSEMWAALLANAADSTSRREVKPGFIEVLKQITAHEALLMEHIFSYCLLTQHENKFKNNSIDKEVIDKIVIDINYPSTTLDSDIDNLVRNRLLLNTYGDKFGSSTPDDVFYISPFGIEFMLACTPPAGTEDISNSPAS